MLPIEYAYPLDYNGTNVENRIVGERHTITPANGFNFNFIIPRAAPYFESSMTVVHATTRQLLVKGIDWVPSYKFDSASNTAPYALIYAGISILTNQYNGAQIEIEYQTLGGPYTLDEQAITTILANATIDPRTTSWESVSLKPGVYLPDAHLHHIMSTVGYDDLVVAVREIVAAVQNNSGGEQSEIINSHIQHVGNTHGLTLADLNIERFADVYKATAPQVALGINDVNYVTVAIVNTMISSRLANANAEVYDAFSGQRGQVPFINSEDPLDITADHPVSVLGIVHNASELTAQLQYRESFKDVFNDWRRIAYVLGNPESIPEELTGWNYDSNADKILSTINSTSRIAMLSPTKVDGDYVFEVELTAINNDDDIIGVCLGLEPTDKGVALLAAYRTATVSGGSYRLEFIDSDGIVSLVQETGLTAYPNGWNGYAAIGPVPLKVTRVGNIITISTGNAGGGYTYTRTFDLDSNPKTRIFKGPVNLGYLSQSQAGATWNTLQRTGANPKVVAMHTSQVYAWTGSDYALSPEALDSAIRPGRIYQNPLTKRLYVGTTGRGTVLRLGGNAVLMDRGNEYGVLDSSVVVNDGGHTHIGNYLNWWSHHPVTQTMTYRGLISRTANDAMDIRGAGVTDFTLWLGDGDARHGGLRATRSQQVGLVDRLGTLRAYVGSDNKWNHYGLNQLSDERLKSIIDEFDFSNVSISDLTLFEYQWKEDDRIPADMWGTTEVGPLAQDVQRMFPHCVSVDPETGLLGIDKASLALTLTVGLAKKLKALGIDV